MDVQLTVSSQRIKIHLLQRFNKPRNVSNAFREKNQIGEKKRKRKHLCQLFKGQISDKAPILHEHHATLVNVNDFVKLQVNGTTVIALMRLISTYIKVESIDLESHVLAKGGYGN